MHVICVVPLYSLIKAQYFLILQYFFNFIMFIFKFPSTNVKNFWIFDIISTVHLLITSFFLKIKWSIAFSFKDSLHFLCSFNQTCLHYLHFTLSLFVYIRLISYTFKWQYCRHWKGSWNKVTYFSCGWMVRIVLHPSSLFIKHSASS